MPSILIVDDDEKLGSVLDEELREVGFNSDFVTNADDAISHAEQRNIDLILLDLKMPHKDGFYVMRKLKEKKIETRIIVLTAFVDSDSAIESAKLGANDFVSKPYDFTDLMSTVRKVLELEEHEN